MGRRVQGKVRDVYELPDRIVLVATDRLSAFDRNLTCVPLKGEVLCGVSRWWFEQTRDLCPNHVLSYPHPNVLVAKRCSVFPIEVVVRAFITGTTSTSLWTAYHAGARSYCGLDLPEGLRKNERLAHPVLTPTTKEAEHDRPIAPAEIVAEGWMSAEDWARVAELALAVFQRGQALARAHGLLLVDTKYEFGRDADGTICLVDEIHTPDSSRYWLADSYEARFARGEEPENIDKEFLRLWYVKHCDPYRDATVPDAPAELVLELARRYLLLARMITGEAFPLPSEDRAEPAALRAAIEDAVHATVAPACAHRVVLVSHSYEAALQARVAAIESGVVAGRADVAIEVYVDKSADGRKTREACAAIVSEDADRASAASVVVVVAAGAAEAAVLERAARDAGCAAVEVADGSEPGGDEGVVRAVRARLDA